MRSLQPVVVLASLTCVLAACSSPDLPEGWESARSLAITQPACSGDPAYGEQAVILATGHAAGIDVSYRRATFRCEQKVEAFLKEKDGAFDVLFQPKDMSPLSVAKCDCAYDLQTTFGAPSGAHTVTVWRRGDRYGSQGDPEVLRQGASEATVP